MTLSCVYHKILKYSIGSIGQLRKSYHYQLTCKLLSYLTRNVQMMKEKSNLSFYRLLLLYGVGIAFLLLFVKYLDYGLFVRAVPFEIYVGVIALIFTILGIWMGLKLTTPKIKTVEIPSQRSSQFVLSKNLQSAKGISDREYEVLTLIASGHSNKEIAEELYISLSTVKTHTSRLFDKLDAKRRTQVIQKAKEAGLLP